MSAFRYLTHFGRPQAGSCRSLAVTVLTISLASLGSTAMAEEPTPLSGAQQAVTALQLGLHSNASLEQAAEQGLKAESHMVGFSAKAGPPAGAVDASGAGTSRKDGFNLALRRQLKTKGVEVPPPGPDRKPNARQETLGGVLAYLAVAGPMVAAMAVAMLNASVLPLAAFGLVGGAATAVREWKKGTHRENKFRFATEVYLDTMLGTVYLPLRAGLWAQKEIGPAMAKGLQGLGILR